MKNVPLYIAGEFIQSQTKDWIEVTNPATNEVIAKAPNTTHAEMEQAIKYAGEVFKTWKEAGFRARPGYAPLSGTSEKTS